MLNYYEIGQRIRGCRRELALSQEELSERVGISVTHMSHIENGTTKPSLQVLADLATVLNADADYLLFGTDTDSNASLRTKVLNDLSNCNNQQLHVIGDTVRALVTALKKHK